MRFKHVVALVGLAGFAAAFDKPGAYERLYFYYAYQLDIMTGGKEIAPGCKDCGFEQFVNFIQGPDSSVSISAQIDNKLPDVDGTAKILLDGGHTGRIDVNRVVHKSTEYPDLFTNVADVVKRKQYSGIAEGKTTATLAQLEKVRANVLYSMKNIFYWRLKASVESFKPYKNFKIHTKAGGTDIDIPKTVLENKGGTTERRLEELWTKHTGGGPGTKELVESFKPFNDVTAVSNTEVVEGFKPSMNPVAVVNDGNAKPEEKRTARPYDEVKTIEANPGMTKKFLHAQWRENIKGNHEGNLKALHEDIEAVNPVLCKPLGASRKMKRQSSLCDWENPFEADKEKPFPNGDEGSNKPKGEATPEEKERQKRSKSVSKQKYEEFANKHGLSEVPNKVNKDLTTFRKDFFKYEALEATSPRLRPGSGGVALKVAGVAGSALWVGEVVHAFTTDMSLMDRATIMTSIIPFVGCVMNALDGIVKNRNEIFNGIDSTLCLIGDAFAMGGFIPGVVIVEVARWIVSLFEPTPDVPTHDELLKARDDIWHDKFIRKRVFKYIYAAVRPHGAENAFVRQLALAFGTESLAIASAGAEQIGALNASSMILDPGTDLDQGQLETGAEQAIANVTEQTSAEIIRRQRKYLLSLPVQLKENATTFLLVAGEAYKSQFSERIKDEKTIQIYPNKGINETLAQLLWAASQAESPNSLPRPDEYSTARAHLKKAAEELSKTSLPMPGSLDIAFVLGQSKALNLSEETLSVMGYIQEHMPDKPEEERQKVAIQYAFSIIKFGDGEIKESELPDNFPIQDDSIRRGLYTLLVIQLGRVLETGKRLLISASGKYPTPNEVEWASLPLRIPVKIDKDTSALVACMIGMIDATTWWKYEEKRDLSDEERSEFESALKSSREIVEAYQS